MRLVAFWQKKLKEAEVKLKELEETQKKGFINVLTRDPRRKDYNQAKRYRRDVSYFMWSQSQKRKNKHDLAKVKRQIDFYQQRIVALTSVPRGRRELFL